MNDTFSISKFSKIFPDDSSCLEEIKLFKYPKGIFCPWCYKITKHYKITNRTSYACEFCRHHVYPLKNTIFEKTTTSLRLWFFCMYILLHARGKIPIKKLQHELGVSYKTAWRMKSRIQTVLKMNRSHILEEPEKVLSVSFFNAFELKIVNKEETS